MTENNNVIDFATRAWTATGIARFNPNLIVCRAQVRDTPNADGGRMIIFDRDRVVLEDVLIEAKTIVRLAAASARPT